MANRTGEKIGWIGGWSGAFLWVVVLSIVFLFQRKNMAGCAGLGLATVAAVVVAIFAPWRHPRTPLWKLMLPLYAIVAACVVWAVLAFGVDALREEGVSVGSFALVGPLFLPLVTAGRQRWSDREP
ncbi:MAG: hypothetical protein MUC50_06620 [Myxococcota bacterium]|nr:hypothetical protein [Myxococcota bacterium]